MLILDTDHVSLLERSAAPHGTRLRDRLKSFRPEEYGTTIVSYEEQCRGWLAVLAKAPSVKDQIEAYRRLHEQLRLYCAVNLIGFEERAAVEFQRLKKSKVRVGTMDLKIAAITLANDATLLSRNLRDFTKVPGLKVEDWTRE